MARAAAATSNLAADEFAPTAVPHIRLFAERLAVLGDEGDYRDDLVPVLALAFDYEGTRLRVSDPRRHFFSSRDGALVRVDRDTRAERRAQQILEGFGAIELACQEEYVTVADSEADYLLTSARNPHAVCSFGAHAVPQLRRLGWRVEIDPDYPFQLVGQDAPFYAQVGSDDQSSDWFTLELGVEVDGRRIDLLPALLDVIEEHRGDSTLDDLARMPARVRAVSAGDKQWVVLPPERLHTLLKVLIELYGGRPRGAGEGRPAPPIPAVRAGGLVRLEAALGSRAQIDARASSALVRGRALAAGPPADAQTAGNQNQEPESSPFPPVKAELRPYQREGVVWMQHLRALGAGGVLADDMGLGKTLQTITHLCEEKRGGRMDLPSLVVMPTSLVGNWQRELARFAPWLSLCVWYGADRRTRRADIAKADVVLTTYPLLVRDGEKILAEQPFHYVILDEAQAIKNRRSLVSHAAAMLQARQKLCLTGTPIENNLDELWSLFDFLSPGLLGNLDEFRSHFRVAIERDGDESRLDALRGRVAPFVLRRTKEQVARDLPPKTEIVRPVELGGDQRDLYESIRVAAHADVRKAIRLKGLAGSAIAILDALMKLRQVCCDPRLVAVDAARRVRNSAKYEHFMSLLETQLAQGRRVLVFSQFARMLALISQGLDERDIRHVTLTGATADRQKQVDAFEGRKVDVFLISLKAGGTGLNLTSADTVIHYDPWWNPAAQAQATDRAYRIGQTRPVFVYSLIVSGSVEERMLGLQQRKKHLADSIVAPGAESQRPAFSMDEVEGLFAPLPEDGE